ncbi:MAG: methyltransferase domain-containing protein [Parvibaculum sp.]|uniref:methyltransferase domain-containing protein n=1 Tax=Parvibaculum sp. TaxID=2024848 RepID=UPI003C7097A1
MSESATINLATVGTAELEAMSVPIFAACLDTMSGEAIARFRRMRKLSSSHRVALEKYLAEHPEKRPGGADDVPLPGVAAAKGGSPAKAAKPSGAAKSSSFSGIKKRLRAWWEGVDVKDLDKVCAKAGGPQKTAAPAPARPAPAKPKVVFGPAMSRVEMLQKLWGEGFSLPGGEDFALRLVQGLTFDEKAPCLDIAAGLGGPSRSIGREYNIQIEGLEADPAIAAAGHGLSMRVGLGDMSPIRAGNAETETFENGRYGAIFAREMLFAIPERKALLTKLQRALAPNGALIITDFALSNDERPDAALKAWRAAEPVKPVPARIDEYGEMLAALNFKVRSFNDLSSEYVPFIQLGWKHLHTCLQDAKLPPETATMLMAEGNVWLARSKALESGRLRLLHFVAHPA